MTKRKTSKVRCRVKNKPRTKKKRGTKGKRKRRNKVTKRKKGGGNEVPSKCDDIDILYKDYVNKYIKNDAESQINIKDSVRTGITSLLNPTKRMKESLTKAINEARTEIAELVFSNYLSNKKDENVFNTAINDLMNTKVVFGNVSYKWYDNNKIIKLFGPAAIKNVSIENIEFLIESNNVLDQLTPESDNETKKKELDDTLLKIIDAENLEQLGKDYENLYKKHKEKLQKTEEQQQHDIDRNGTNFENRTEKVPETKKGLFSSIVGNLWNRNSKKLK